MTDDVRKWLAEIRDLKAKVDSVQQEREQAYQSADKWRTLYETEAKQRRTDANLARQQIEMLQSELQQLRDFRYGRSTSKGNSEPDQDLRSQIEQLSPDQLQDRLLKALKECDRLAAALKTEQANHAQTRDSLTTALGDTVDLLTKGREGG